MNLDKFTEDLIRDEGEVLHAYKDHLGYLTIGVGHLIDPAKGGSISKAASRFILQEDIAEKYQQCKATWPWFSTLNDVRQRAVCNMVFQLGLQGVKNFKKMVAAMEMRDYKVAAREALDSKWAKQTPSRALRIATMIEFGVD